MSFEKKRIEKKRNLRALPPLVHVALEILAALAELTELVLPELLSAAQLLLPLRLKRLLALESQALLLVVPPQHLVGALPLPPLPADRPTPHVTLVVFRAALDYVCGPKRATCVTDITYVTHSWRARG